MRGAACSRAIIAMISRGGNVFSLLFIFFFFFFILPLPTFESLAFTTVFLHRISGDRATFSTHARSTSLELTLLHGLAGITRF